MPARRGLPLLLGTRKMYRSFGVEQSVGVDDASSCPAWHKQLVSFLEQHTSQQNLCRNLEVASVIEQAKQEYVDQYRTISKLVSLSLHRTLQPEYKYADCLSAVKCFSNKRLLSRFRCGCYGLHVDTGHWTGTDGQSIMKCYSSSTPCYEWHT